MFAIHGHLLPRVSTYEQAVALYEKTPEPKAALPYNARLLRPNTQDTSKLIARHVNAVEFIFHQTSLVQWFSPDEIRVFCHDSVSSRIFIDRFLPPGMVAVSHRGDTTINGYKPKNKSITFRRKNDVWYPDPDDLANETTYKVDLKRAAAIRKLLKPVLEWGQALETLSGQKITFSMGTFDAQTELAQLLSLPEIPTKNYRFVMQYLNQFTWNKDWKPMDVALAVGGAVKKVELPPGTMPVKSRWEDYSRFIPDTIV